MIKLKELELKNFISHKHTVLKNLDSTGLLLLRGKNGSGKSGVRVAIEYLMLDQTSEDKSVDELTFNGEGNCEIRGVFDLDGVEVIITKYREHKKEKNAIDITVNGVLQDRYSNRADAQKQILNLFKIEPSVVFISTMFSQNTKSFPELKDSERKNIFYQPLKLYEYEGYKKKAETLRKGKEKEVKEIENTIEVKKALWEQLEEQIEREKNRKTEQDQRNAIKIKELSEIIETIKPVSTKHLVAELKKLNANKLEEFKESTKALKIRIDETVSIRDNVSSRRVSLDQELSILKRDKTKLEKDISSYKESICPILDISCESLSGDKNLIKDCTRNVKGLMKKEVTLVAEIKSLREEADKANTLIDTLRLEQKELDNVISNIVQLQTDLREAELANQTIDARIEGMNNNIDNIKKEISKRLDQSELTEKIKELKTFIKSVYKQVSSLNEEILYLKFWENGFSRTGIPNLKIETILGELEDKVNENLSMLYPNAFVEITGQSELKNSKEIREKISYNVYHPDRKGITSYRSFSGGQRQRIRVADTLAFYSLLSTFGFIFLDEMIEDKLDPQGVESVIQFLGHKSKEIGTIFVVSHNEMIKDKFSNVIEFALKDGISCIEHSNY